MSQIVAQKLQLFQKFTAPIFMKRESWRWNPLTGFLSLKTHFSAQNPFWRWKNSLWNGALVTLHMHTTIWLNRTNGSWDTKQNGIWPLTFICITKMASYQLDLIMWYDCLVTLHMHTTFGLNRTNGSRDPKQREYVCVGVFACVCVCVCVCDIRTRKWVN